ncbi:MAG TPA: sugar-transfer associated ATP-grasp domain-containing protein [Gemmatimonadales bacterium]|nr:sugar-transfer associated ATP-grasp domain-containing protein [Gemmatimonadales bacterium]
MSRLGSGLAVLRAARRVARERGKPVLSQLGEMVRLRFGPGRIGGTHYYWYELYDDRLAFAEKQAFVNWNWDYLADRLNCHGWGELCDDKLLTYAALGGLGLPFPAIRALYHPGGRTWGSAPAFAREEDLAAFLRSGMTYPVFGKPANDRQGGGASALLGYDAGTDRLRLPGGTTVPVEEYVREVPARAWAGVVNRADAARGGYLFQEHVVPHPEVARLTGGRSGTLRLVVLLWPDGPRIHRALGRAAVGDNVMDNQGKGTGNLRLRIDRDTGTVVQAVRTPWRALPHAPIGGFGEPIEAHPDTGIRTEGFVYPCWPETVALCLRAARAFPAIRCQAWDLAIGPDGPTLVELNMRGGVQQLPGGLGFNDGEFRDFLRAVKLA